MATFIQLTNAEYETAFLLNVDEIVCVDHWVYKKNQPASLVTTKSPMPISSKNEVIVLEAFDHIAQLLEAVRA